jgi:hypothetical protein
VCAYRKQWQAKISYDGERHHLGNFDTRQEAALAYDKEVRKCGGENKLLNYNTTEEAEEAAAQARVEYGPSRQRARPASGYYGVYAKGKRWQSMVCFGSKKHHLGSFDTKQEAALAYDKEARKSGKEGKMLNYDTIEEAEEAAAQAQTQTTYARRQGRVKTSRRRVDAGEKDLSSRGVPMNDLTSKGSGLGIRKARGRGTRLVRTKALAADRQASGERNALMRSIWCRFSCAFA